MASTNEQYDSEVKTCRNIYFQKTRDYGTSWRVLRPISITDQLFIKAKRIRTLQETKEQKIGEDKAGEFRAMVNYGVIGLIQLSLEKTATGVPQTSQETTPETRLKTTSQTSQETTSETSEDLPVEEAMRRYDENIALARSTMIAKNHDYGEAWREMSQESFTDLILMKLLRIRQIIANDGKTLISEGIDSNYIDIINYSLFALILITEGKHSS